MVSERKKVTVHLISFVDSRFRSTTRRFKRRGKRFQKFDTIRVLDETGLERRFSDKHKQVLNSGVKGFGFYCWKPQVIHQELRKLEDGEFLVYVDAGSHFSKHGRARFEEYLEICASSKLGILAFQTEWKEKHWTKGDVLAHFDAKDIPEVTETGQIQAGFLVIRNSQIAREFVSEWRSAIEFDFSLIDNSPSKTQDLDGFIRHRHDQSIFSVLAKLRGIATLSASEQEKCPGELTWRGARHFPVHHKRDLPGHPRKAWAVRYQSLTKFLVKRIDLLKS